VIPRAGALGAAAVTACVACVASLACAWAACRLWRVRAPWPTLARALVIGAAVYAASAFLPTPGLWCVPKVAVLCALAAFALLLSGEFGARPFERVRTLIVTRREVETSAPLEVTREASS
ncbi:MAG TPA: hypothetical protein VFX96_10700, partial [Pyrinomonadaceae bacterium]|nr:hypothetical protein [Pyrinomonadaceae bacterium]